MTSFERRLCAWGGPYFVVCFGLGLLISGFVPPPAPSLSGPEIAEFYRTHAVAVRAGMLLSLFGVPGFIGLVCAISVRMRQMRGAGALGRYLQLGGGVIGVLTVMFPMMIFAITAFRTDRDPSLTQALNDVGWLIIIPAFPTFLAQFVGIALGITQDRGPTPVFPRWAAYFNIWMGVLFVPGGFAYFFHTGPLAWDGVIAFWLAAGAFFVWLLVMTWLLLRAPEPTDTGDGGVTDSAGTPAGPARSHAEA